MVATIGRNRPFIEIFVLVKSICFAGKAFDVVAINCVMENAFRNTYHKLVDPINRFFPVVITFEWVANEGLFFGYKLCDLNL